MDNISDLNRLGGETVMKTSMCVPMVISLAFAMQAGFPADEEFITVRITADGSAIVKDTLCVTPEDLKRELTRLNARKVRILPDRVTRYVDVAKFMKVVQELGLDMGLKGATSE
jgi:biopolymer transport protein ExbD